MSRYIVSVVCENELKFIGIYDEEREAINKYTDLCRHWYNREAFEKFVQNRDKMKLRDAYDAYYGSMEYHNWCDYANVTLEEENNNEN